MKTAFLTVDWDYFIPCTYEQVEELEEDMGADGIEDWWSFRYLSREMKCTPEATSFWGYMWPKKPKTACVSESHLAAHHLLKDRECDEIVLVDQHHDCYTEGGGPGCDNAVDVTCGNWARIWLEADPKRRMTWVRPDWLVFDQRFRWDDRVPSHLKERVSLVTMAAFRAEVKYYTFVEPAHICRSGGWTPPWLDRNFKDFVKRGKFKHIEVIDPDVLRNRQWKAKEAA